MDISFLRERDSSGSLSVSELNNFIKNLLDTNRTLASVSVTGEVSNLKNHASGHMYFSLKDSEAQIKAVMFRSQRSKLKIAIEDGMRVTVHGSVSLYSQSGTVQIYVNSIELDGVGALYVAYEKLKEKLFSEGLFDEDHKKLIPLYPRKIGVITSPSGAAVRDIITVTKRRYPIADIYLYPALVQGDGAEGSLIKALDFFESSGLADVVIIGRGGGSIEDLWAFNGEQLARKIYDFSIPIISAVGHETDFTICDFVSDMRAPTPSAAAEIAVPDIKELLLRIDDNRERLVRSLIRITERKREQLSSFEQRELFASPEKIFETKEKDILHLYESALASTNGAVQTLKNRLAVVAGKAEAMSPLSVLNRGYSVCEKEDCTVKKVSSLKVGDEVKIIFSDGDAFAKVDSVREN